MLTNPSPTAHQRRLQSPLSAIDKTVPFKRARFKNSVCSSSNTIQDIASDERAAGRAQLFPKTVVR
jgi:hypothetical protein